MEYPLWVSRVLVERKEAPSKQPGQGTRWGSDTDRVMVGAGMERGFSELASVC